MGSGAARVIGFSLLKDPAASYYALAQGDDVALMHGDERIVMMSQLKIAGLHNAANALASLAMADALESGSRSAACRRCANFPGSRIARSGSRTSMKCATSTIRRARTSARRWPPLPACQDRWSSSPAGRVKARTSRRSRRRSADKVRHVVLLGQDAKLDCRRAAGRLPRWSSRATCRKPCRWRRTRRVPARLCCCHRRARASTCSVTTHIVAMCSPPRCGGCAS